MFCIVFLRVPIGGGKIHLHISGTLAVDGFIKANSFKMQGSSLGGGGSGGSVLVYTSNFTGKMVITFSFLYDMIIIDISSCRLNIIFQN